PPHAERPYEALSRMHTPSLGAGIRLPTVRCSVSSSRCMGRLGLRVQVKNHDCGLAARPRLFQVPAQPKTSRGTWRHRDRTVRVWRCLYRSIQCLPPEHQSVRGGSVRSRPVCCGLFPGGADRCLYRRGSWPTRVPTTEVAPVKNDTSQKVESPSRLIDARIKELGDWRGETLRRMRTLIKEADPDIVEEWKWVKATNPGTPVWSHDGIICTGESYKSTVKLTFAKGASLKDPAKLFNSSLDGNLRRAIDIHEGETVDAAAFKTLIRSAVALNTSGGKAKPKRAK